MGNTDSIKFYLYKSLRLRIIRRLNKESKLGREDVNTEIYDFTITLSHESRLITHQQDAEQRKILSLAIDNLSRRQKEAIQLKYYDNLNYTEIAGIMAISVDSVYKLISGALALLKKQVRQVHFSVLWSSTMMHFLLFFA